MFRPHLTHAGVFAGLCAILLLTALPCRSLALDLDTAIAMARENIPSLKASRYRVQSSDALYKASLSPYFPSLDANGAQAWNDTTLGDYDQRTYDIALSYTLFDGGKRSASRNIAEANRDITRDDFATETLQLEFNVKSAFYSTLARKDIVEERKTQLRDAQKDYEVAHGRHRLGVAKLSDVLQASVRREQARYNLVQAEGDLSKGLTELNSLIGRTLDAPYDLQGTLDVRHGAPDRTTLSNAAMARPELKRAENAIKITKNNVTLQTSAFYPVVSASGSYSRIDGGLYGTLPNDTDQSIGIYATWNIFELGKLYKTRSAQIDIKASEENLNEMVRQILLDVAKAHEDFMTATKDVVVAEEQYRSAAQNYDQAFGEYKVGKGDILSLVTAESALARAQEQQTLSRLRLMLSKALLERASGVEKLELLLP
ncbi:MAG TPA: TolC family protein [Syntrophobacteraceae bacterium]|nr:TolC family protein [Syntrophobacteraceae bacterium]